MFTSDHTPQTSHNKIFLQQPSHTILLKPTKKCERIVLRIREDGDWLTAPMTEEEDAVESDEDDR